MRGREDIGLDPEIFRSGGTAVGGIDRALRQPPGLWAGFGM
jgi:hypothetical protein